MKRLDARQIKREVDIVDVLEHVSGRRVGSVGGGYKKIHCPYHPDKNPSASVNSAKGRFTCFTCDLSFDVIDLAQHYLNSDFREACDWLKQNFLT